MSLLEPEGLHSETNPNEHLRKQSAEREMSKRGPKKVGVTDWKRVLVYKPTKVHQSQIRRAYDLWRAEQRLPVRCDNPDCRFYTEPLVWNGKPFKPILDHREGNRYDNSPKNLRFLWEPVISSGQELRKSILQTCGGTGIRP